MTNIYLFFGPPGSGKGTLTTLCIQEFNWYQLSTGNLCREHIQRGSQIGKKIESLIKQGELVPDEIIADMVKQTLLSMKEMPKNIIFDGYPRTAKQAELLYALLQESLKEFNLSLIKLNIDQELLLERILTRVFCSNKACQRVYSLMAGSAMHPKKDMICDDCNSPLKKRSDDTPETLNHRLDAYYKHEQEIVDFYIDKGVDIGMLNGAQTVQGLFEEFKNLTQQKAYVC